MLGAGSLLNPDAIGNRGEWQRRLVLGSDHTIQLS